MADSRILYEHFRIALFLKIVTILTTSLYTSNYLSFFIPSNECRLILPLVSFCLHLLKFAQPKINPGLFPI